MIKRFALIAFVFLVALQLQAQFSNPPAGFADSLPQLSSAYLDNISSKATKLQTTLDRKSKKAIQQLLKAEERIKRKLTKTDSLKAAALFNNTGQRYQNLKDKRQLSNGTKPYLPVLDTIATSLKFLQQNPQLLSSIKAGDQKLKEALSKVNVLEDQLQKAEEIKKIIRERKEYLKNQLQNLGFAKELKKISKTSFYYAQQISGAKELLKDHRKAERKAFGLLSKSSQFQKFMRRHSMLASLFRLPGDPDDPSTAVANLAGLQTRSQVNNLIQQQLSNSGPNAQQQLQQNLSEAHNKINELKNKG